jgi:hypothetical protein
METSAPERLSKRRSALGYQHRGTPSESVRSRNIGAISHAEDYVRTFRRTDDHIPNRDLPGEEGRGCVAGCRRSTRSSDQRHRGLSSASEDGATGSRSASRSRRIPAATFTACLRSGPRGRTKATGDESSRRYVVRAWNALRGGTATDDGPALGNSRSGSGSAPSINYPALRDSGLDSRCLTPGCNSTLRR